MNEKINRIDRIQVDNIKDSWIIYLEKGIRLWKAKLNDAFFEYIKTFEDETNKTIKELEKYKGTEDIISTITELENNFINADEKQATKNHVKISNNFRKYKNRQEVFYPLLNRLKEM
ncbi:MAG: hypothetical protein QXO65_03325 [Candidatus Aenigmatarchaeota archaeon]